MIHTIIAAFRAYKFPLFRDFHDLEIDFSAFEMALFNFRNTKININDMENSEILEIAEIARK